MRNADIHRILIEVSSAPWAILPEKLADIRNFLRSRVNGIEITEAELQAMNGGRADTHRLQQVGSVAVIPVFGTLIDRANMLTEFSGGTSTEMLRAQIQSAASDPSISSIMLDINSPGGSVAGITETHQVILDARGQKPVTAAVNAMAASAAYWLASASTEIVMTPSGTAGSIGVFALHEDLSGAAEQAGVKMTFISAGRFKTEGNPFEPLSDEARRAIQADVDKFYEMFVRDVAKGRGTTAQNVRDNYGQGRMLLASSAKAAGMADRIEAFDMTLARLTGGKAVSPSRRAERAAPVMAEDMRRKLDLLNI